MAKFVFKLQKVLTIKEKEEDQQKIAYGLANNALLEEQLKLKELLNKRGEYEISLKNSQQGILDIKKINYYKKAIDTMKVLIREQMFALKRAEDALEAERKKLDDIMKEKKTYEKLKEHAFEDFKKELIAEESKAIDGLVSFTYGAK